MVDVTSCRGSRRRASGLTRTRSSTAGKRVEITDAELAAADRFEAPFSYKRVSAILTSGREAWVYVHAVD
jgi:hypothetical protein